MGIEISVFRRESEPAGELALIRNQVGALRGTGVRDLRSPRAIVKGKE